MSTLPTIDWTSAARTARTLTPAGPTRTPTQIQHLVAELHLSAERADTLIAEVAQLPPTAAGRTYVVDRGTWIDAQAASLAALFAELDATLSGAEPTDSGPAELAPPVGGVEAGTVLAALAPRILGQFDPFASPQRLLLIAPNIAAVEHKLELDPADFRLWVCLHEQTHRLQFAAAPWLPGYLKGLMAELLMPRTGSPLSLRFVAGGSWMESLLHPEQRATFAQLTAVMSVLEGHADTMMDRVGIEVLPSLPAMRAAMTKRRADLWNAVVGKVMGMDLKMAQYREGAAFCRHVIDAIGVAGLNAVFAQPDLLPSLDELRDPTRWLDRVTG